MCDCSWLAGAATLNAQGPGTASHFPLGNYFEELRGSQSKGDLRVASGSEMHVGTTGRNKRTGTASMIGTGIVSTLKTVKTKLVSVFITKFASDVDSKTLHQYLKDSRVNRDAKLSIYGAGSAL